MSITGIVKPLAKDTKRILELRKEGVSYRLIALAVDLSHETVRRICKQHLD